MRISESLQQSFKGIFGDSNTIRPTPPFCPLGLQLPRKRGKSFYNTGPSASSDTSSRIRKVLRILFPNLFGRQKVGGWRPVLDLQRLNRFIQIEHFKMEALNRVTLTVQPEDCMGSIDLQDAYLHIPIHHDFQSFLRIKIGELHLQFQCLPFGISTAPRTFTKVLVVILAPFQEKGIRVLLHLCHAMSGI